VGNLGKLHNDLQACRSPSVVRVVKSRGRRWAGHVARSGETRSADSILVGELSGKRPLARPRRCEHTIKTHFREAGWEVDRTSSGSCPVAGFGVRNVKPCVALPQC
jgi:hypothetical protein